VIGAAGRSTIKTLTFGFRVAASSGYTIVLNEVEFNTGCPLYKLKITNAPLDAVVNRVSGPGPAAIAGQVSGFRTSLGAERQDITWDDVPESLADPGLLPADYFNTVQPRGLVFTGDSRAKVSSDGSGATPAEFGGVAPGNPAAYQPFSGVRMMGAEPAVAELAFRVAGTGTPAPTRAFAAVLVSPGTEGYFLPRGADGNPLGIYVPPAEPNGLGFYGIRFSTPKIWSMSLAGDWVHGIANGTVFDDFVYADPGIALTVTTSGPGKVTAPGVACPGDCGQRYPPGPVTLTAVPTGPGRVLWGGACSEAGTAKQCVVTLDEARSVSAAFTSCQKQATKVKKLKKVVKKKKRAVSKAKRALAEADRPVEVAEAKADLARAQKALKKAKKKLKVAKKRLKRCLG
jgi:hypothetical protein